MDHSYDQQPPASDDSLQGPWGWWQASSWPESTTTSSNLPDLNSIPSTNEANASILRDEPSAGPLTVPEDYPLPDIDYLPPDDGLAFQTPNTFLPQISPSPSTWLPTAAELELAGNPDPFQGLDPVAWALLVHAIGPVSLFDDSFTPLPTVGGGEMHDQSPMTSSPAPADHLDVPLFNLIKPTILPKPSPSASTSASPSTSSLSSSSPSASPPRGTAAAYICSSCSAPFTGARALRAHRLRHTRPFACPVCARGHASRKDMYRHAWAHHAADAARLDLPAQTRRCPVCDVEERADNLVRHLRSKHGRGPKG